MSAPLGFNRLLSLGEDAFLELIAIDPKAPFPDHPRWFDLDRFHAEPILGTWVLGTDDIEATLAEAHPESGLATRITRGELNWLISIPEDGSMPMDGAFPTLIEWPEGAHPATRMIDLGCRLHSLTVEHPEAEQIEMLIGDRIDQASISIRNGATKNICAKIQTPDGIRILP